MNKLSRNIILWILAGLLVLILFNYFQSPSENNKYKEWSYDQLITRVKTGSVKSIDIYGNNVQGLSKEGEYFKSRLLKWDPEMSRILRETNVQINVKGEEKESFAWLQILISWFPMLLFIGIWLFVLRQMHSGGKTAMDFGKSKAKMFAHENNQITFASVAGIEEAKEEVSEIVEFLKEPEKFDRLGGKIPKGVLLAGSPGTGKTLLAKAIAGEAEVPFFSISGSEFVEMFVGVGAKRVRDMFEQGKKHSPCIIFIDEIDAVGRHRGAGLGGGNDEREQTLNQLLVEMDGFESNEGVIILAATNRPDVLDPALLRPGRFDRQVLIPLPDIKGREAILKVHMRKVPLSRDVNTSTIARGTPGFSGAELENLVNEAALLAARRNKNMVTTDEMEEAKDKVMMGAQRKSMVMSKAEKELTAYHEAGHAITAIHMKDSDPIHKATIIPRGRALGMVMRLPEKDRLSVTRAKLLSDLVVAMGGRVAEEITFGYQQVTTGASSDIAQATEIARNMATKWGMSDKLGPLAYGEPEREVFLGHSVTENKNISDSTAENIDSEIKRFIEEAYQQAKNILKTHHQDLEKIAQALLEYETLSGDEINDLLKGNMIRVDVNKIIEKQTINRTSVPASEE